MTSDSTPLEQQRAAIVQRLISEQLDIHQVWIEPTWTTLCDLESRRGVGPTFSTQEREYKRMVAAFEDTLNPEQRDAFADIDAARIDLNATEQRTAFELGKDFATAATSRRPIIERFIAAAQAARRLPARGHDEDHDILKDSVEELRQAIPVARQILLTSRPLDSVSNPLEAYVLERTTAATESDQPGVERDAVFHVALALGLLLSEAV
jgi:hypothetical protein